MMPAAIQVTQAAVIAAAFLLVTIIGLFANRWRRGDLRALDEWALGGRKFGGVLTWFLQGGSVYTTYSFIAVPGLVFGAGAIGFFALPYLVIAYPIAFLFIPRLWEVARRHGYVTTADLVRGRYGSRPLTLAVTITGIVAMMPYIALQVYGIEVSIAQVGLPVEASLWIAFVVLALVTYVSGLRAATLIAIVKDVFIWITVIVAVIYIPLKLGGYAKAFSHVPASKLTLTHAQFADYVTLAIGSGLALFLYPHTVTGALSASSKYVVQRNSVFLPIYTIMLGLLAVLGYLAIAAGIPANGPYGANAAVPALLDHFFPPALAGFGLASIAIGALVPAAMMAIAAANLFARNIYTELIEPDATPARQTQVSKLASLLVKFGAVGFVLLVPSAFVINFQLAAGVWILQTLPAVVLGLFWRGLDARAALAGLAAGLFSGTALLLAEGFKSSSYEFSVGGHHVLLFIGVPTLALNLLIVLAGSLLARGTRRLPALAVSGESAPLSGSAQRVP
jgi:SSS family solute:Na+ symporter